MRLVDDGKSTLIGRLLYDSKQILADQLEHIEETSERRGDGYVNLALLTDGLRAERAGDHDRRRLSLVLHAAPSLPARGRTGARPVHAQHGHGHVDSRARDRALDARKGVVEQTRRHTYIASVLGTPHIAAAVNKMDLVGYDERRFGEIEQELDELASRLGAHDLRAIPISALNGDNVVERSQPMSWYEGPTLLEHLETVEIKPATATSTSAASWCSG